MQEQFLPLIFPGLAQSKDLFCPMICIYTVEYSQYCSSKMRLYTEALLENLYIEDWLFKLHMSLTEDKFLFGKLVYISNSKGLYMGFSKVLFVIDF